MTRGEGIRPRVWVQDLLKPSLNSAATRGKGKWGGGVPIQIRLPALLTGFKVNLRQLGLKYSSPPCRVFLVSTHGERISPPSFTSRRLHGLNVADHEASERSYFIFFTLLIHVR